MNSATTSPSVAQPGDELPVRTVGPLTRMDFARYSIATADPNRVHLEEDVAAAAGLPTVIGSGGMLGGIAADVVTAWGGLGSVRRASTKLLFPLFPDTTVTLRPTVSARRADADGDIVVVVVTAASADGTVLFEGTYEVAVSS